MLHPSDGRLVWHQPSTLRNVYTPLKAHMDPEYHWFVEENSQIEGAIRPLSMFNGEHVLGEHSDGDDAWQREREDIQQCLLRDPTPRAFRGGNAVRKKGML